MTHKSSSSDNCSGNQQASGSKLNNHQHSKLKDQKDQKKPYSGKSSSTEKTNTIADLLRVDGKLKSKERKCCLDNKLCLRCERAGHSIADYNPKPKGRAATATATPTSANPSGTDSRSGKA